MIAIGKADGKSSEARCTDFLLILLIKLEGSILSILLPSAGEVCSAILK